MAAIVISSESSDDSDFEREIEEAKRRSLQDFVGKRSDVVGEGSCTIKVTELLKQLTFVEIICQECVFVFPHPREQII